MVRAGRELQVQLLLNDLKPVIVALSETEVPVEDNVVFQNYKVFYPLLSEKRVRLLLLLREDFAAKNSPTVIKSTNMEIWIRLDTPSGPLLAASVYRQWGGHEERDLSNFHDSLREFSSKFGRIVVLGDFNLDLKRIGDPDCYRRRLLRLHMECLSECGFSVANDYDMSPTYYSHGAFDDGSGHHVQKCSVLDHVYHLGLPLPSSFSVLPLAMTDHRPTLTRFDLLHRASGLKTILRRNYKSISNTALCWAINAESLRGVFLLEDVESIHGIIVREINDALDLIAPLQRVQVKEGRPPLYLSEDTRSLMRRRDRAAAAGNFSEYRKLRNRTVRFIRRDRLASNVRLLQKHGFNPKSVWHLANSASGRSQRTALPAELQEEDGGQRVVGDAKLADCVNGFYIDKIAKIRAGIDAGGERKEDQHRLQQQQQQRHQQQDRQQLFQFRIPSEGEILSVIKSLNNTDAVGVDGIPVSVLKGLAPIIAAPISHLVKKSLEYATIPSGFKKALVLPLHKKAKPCLDPGSYVKNIGAGGTEAGVPLSGGPPPPYPVQVPPKKEHLSSNCICPWCLGWCTGARTTCGGRRLRPLLGLRHHRCRYGHGQVGGLWHRGEGAGLAP